MSSSSSAAKIPVITWIQQVNQLWDQHCDPYLIQLPLLQSPILFLSCLLLSCLTVKIAQYFVMRRTAAPIAKPRKSAKGKSSGDKTSDAVKSRVLITDIRPFILVHNGFCFGVYGVGLLILLIQTYIGTLLFSCYDPSLQITEFHEHCIKHAEYTYLIMTFVTFLEPLIKVLGGKGIDSVADLLHQSIWSFLLTIYVVLNPIGITMTTIVIDGIHNVIRYGSAVLSIQYRDKKEYNKAADAMRIVVFSLISAFSYHATSLIQDKSCRVPISKEPAYKSQLFFPIAVYAAIVCAVSVIRLAARFLPPEIAIGKQALSSGRSLRKSVRLTKIPVVPIVK